MRNKLQLQTRKKALRLLSCQLILIMLATVMCFTLTLNYKNTYSLLLGAMCHWLPSCYFALRVFADNTGEPKALLRSFYTGEAHKFLLTALLFGLAFKFFAVNVSYLIFAFIFTSQLIWLAPLFFSNKPKRVLA